jgi:cystathionine gamma-synthase/methionine-gamma-lyase
VKIHSKAVHAGDRKKPGPHIPVTTPIYTAASYFYETTEQLDRVFARETEGYCYSRYENPTAAALEEAAASLENGHGALACASGMAAIQVAVLTALTDRPKRVLAANALYGATFNLLMQVLAPLGVESRFVDICDLAAVEKDIAEFRPGACWRRRFRIRCCGWDARSGWQSRRARRGGLRCDNTFATPLLVRPLELGANLVVHSVTKFLAGHGDVLGGIVVSDEAHYPTLRAQARVTGPVLGPFESYLTLRGVKTFALRMERQCANARRLAAWLRGHPRIERVHYPDDAQHPDAETIRLLLPDGMYGAIVSFELKHASQAEVFAFMDRLRMVVRATRSATCTDDPLPGNELAPRDRAKQRERMGIRDSLLRISVGTRLSRTSSRTSKRFEWSSGRLARRKTSSGPNSFESGVAIRVPL